MKYSPLGSSNVLLSQLCLGTANFGPGDRFAGAFGSTSEAEAFRIMDAAVDAGINFFDTANVYGNDGTGTTGETENIIGRWFAQGGGRREKVFLGTKVGRTMLDNDLDGPNTRDGLSLWKIRRHVEDSLKRLGTDHIELIQMHYVDHFAQWDQVWEAFEDLVRAGKVDYVGSSQFYAWEMMKGQEAARRRNFMGLVSTQHRYDPVSREAEIEAFPCATDQGIGVLLFSPLRRGVFAVDLLDPTDRTFDEEAEELVERYRPQLLEYAKFCHDLGHKVPAVTLAWQLANPAVTAPIIGPATVQDLEELLVGVEIKLGSAELAEVDRIFPPAASHFYAKLPDPVRPQSWV
ncbi:aldo/keto reductase [Microlunatus flavus]|uniref:Predicted oxidoreductase n=1 Tax=Microlunatus flavus TaxID=1036181 RepID=A0A1H9A954_9ACTN|nr:aldo/keto reductase [Microlunatus flavus]SEP72528.1 Predicted oxidoreductase [Microlunatus flavus]